MKKISVILLILSSMTIHCYAQNNQDSGWSIKTTSYKNYIGITLANGRIGLLPSKELFKVKSIILNNVFDRASPKGVSKILKGINFANLSMTIDGELLTLDNIKNWEQTLNMKEASFTTKFTYKNKANISYTLYALRQLPYSALISINIETLKSIEVTTSGFIATPEEYHDIKQGFEILKDNETLMPIMQTTAKSRLKRHLVAASANFIFDENSPQLHHKIIDKNNQSLSFTKHLKPHTSYQFGWFGAEGTTQDFDYPDNESARMLIFGELNKIETLVGYHKEAWEKLWQGDIVIEGDLESQLDIRLALYHLYSFSRADSNLSISPMGLSSQGYNGHIFWDTELWMFPPLLLFNQDIAKSLLNYRFDRLKKARQKARIFGYKGAMFPWESDESGEEATPVWALTGTFEHHITADIGIAVYNYFKVSKDTLWLKEKGYPLLKEIADFWVSRSVKNSDGTYSIKNVVGANEFAQNIDDNAFTNGAAITVLRDANKAAKILNKKANPTWKKVSEQIVIHKFKNGVTKENSSYKGEIIKQADVNLLAYPLHIVNDNSQIEKDLAYYEPKFAKEGPAMAHSILSIIYSRLGHPERAYQLFKSAYVPNKRPPFGALSESATSNNPYFATGAGGMLQTILFGFGGLHITESGIIQKDAVLPKKWKSLTLKGIGPEKKTYTIKQ